MPPLPPEDRPTAYELKNGIKKPATIAGKPASVCPYCGCAMFVNGTRKPAELIRRYVVCRNKNCGRRFESQQLPATLVREIDDDGDANVIQYGT